MAVKINALTEGTLDVVASCDTALDMTETEYEDYLKVLDPSLLKLKPGEDPTIFVMRKVLPYKLAQKIKSKQMIYADGDVFVGTNHISDEVKASLVDIKNPANLRQEDWLKFRRDGEGGAMPDLMALLDSAGITADLYKARKYQMDRESGLGNLKKS
jgi:hypothetical protein